MASIFGAVVLDDGPISSLFSTVVAASPAPLQSPPVAVVSVPITTVDERGLQASRDIQPGEVVVHVPCACFLGPNDISSVVTAAIEADLASPHACSDPLVLRMILLLYECKLAHDRGDGGDDVVQKAELKAKFYATLQYDLTHMPVYLDQFSLDQFGPR
jgi:hypothetical protein